MLGMSPGETIGHIQSAGCLGQREVVIAAHNACIRELLREVNVHGRLGTLWVQEECNEFCSMEELWESVRDEEMKILWKGASEGQPPTEEQYQERFWRRRLDSICLDVITKEFLAIEFKRTQDMRGNHLDEITAVAQKQYKSLLMGLQAIGQNKGWKVQQLDRCLWEEQDKVLRSYYAQRGGMRRNGRSRHDGNGREHVGFDVYM